VWNGHPRHYVFDNSTDFEGKLARIEYKAAKLVGLPHLPRGDDKFHLRSVSGPFLFQSPLGSDALGALARSRTWPSSRCPTRPSTCERCAARGGPGIRSLGEADCLVPGVGKMGAYCKNHRKPSTLFLNLESRVVPS
jgi:hypothetical protein